MTHAEDLVMAGQSPKFFPHGLGRDAADAGIDFIKDERRHGRVEVHHDIRLVD